MIRCHAVLGLILLGNVYAQAREPGQPEPGRTAYALPEDANFTIRDVGIERIVAVKKDGAVSFTIAGSLRVPEGAGPDAGWPAVLWISGSGSQTRHGFAPAGGGRVLDAGSWEIHDAVARAGFVVLSTDDRGVGGTPLGEKGADPREIGYDELVGDAQAALDWLFEREEVDGERVFLIGHSEGGLTAPLLASREEAVAGIVCMGAMGRNLWHVTYDQVAATMKHLPEAMREANLKAQEELMRACKEDREPDFEVLGKAAAPQLEATWKTKVAAVKAWWHDHFHLDVPAIHRSVACPVFIAQGEKDFQTRADQDARRILTNVAGGPCADLSLRVYADLDHLFKPCGGKDSTMAMYFTDRRVDAGFLGDVVAWLQRRAGAR